MGLEVVHLLLLILLECIQYFEIVLLVSDIGLFKNLSRRDFIFKYVLIINCQRIIWIRQFFVGGILVYGATWFFSSRFLSFTEFAEIYYVWNAIIGVVDIRISLVLLFVRLCRLLALLFESVWISFGQLYRLLEAFNLFLLVMWYLLLEALNINILIHPGVISVLLIFKNRVEVHYTVWRVDIILANLLNI